MLRDQRNPKLVVPVEYIGEDQSIFQDAAGLYQLEDIFLHRKTGLCLLRGHPSDWPVALRESGPDDYARLLIRTNLKGRINRIDEHSLEIIDLDTPLYIFNIFQEKSNYWHFVVDNLSRLTLLLEVVRTPITVVHFIEASGFIKQYFALLQELFDCKFLKLSKTGAEHIRIQSPVFFIEDTFQRTYDSVHYYKKTRDRLASDPQLDLLSLSPKDLVETHKTNQNSLTRSYDWMLDKSFIHSRTGKIYKSGAVWLKHSKTALNSVFKVGEHLARARGHARIDRPAVILSVRHDSTRKRILSNLGAVVEMFPQVAPVDFAQLDVEDQILSCYHCETLIGVLGAGLANAIFLRPGARVIEIFPLGYTIPPASFVQDLCESRGLLFTRIFSTALDSSGSTHLDLNKLAEALAESSPL